jgi:hypothetical protein
MGERLHTLGDVPAQAVAADEVVHGAEGDIDIVADPRGADEDEREGGEENECESFIGAGHGRGKFITARHDMS